MIEVDLIGDIKENSKFHHCKGSGVTLTNVFRNIFGHRIDIDFIVQAELIAGIDDRIDYADGIHRYYDYLFTKYIG